MISYKELVLQITDPKYYYYIFFLLFPFTFSFLYGGMIIKSSYLFALFCFILFFVNRIFLKKRLFDHPLLVYFALWMIILILSVLQSIYIPSDIFVLRFSILNSPYLKSYIHVLQIVFYIFFSFSFATVFDTEKKIITAIQFFISGAFIHAGISLSALFLYLFNFSLGSSLLFIDLSRTTRLQGFFQEPGYLAAFTLIIIPLCIFMYIKTKQKRYIGITLIQLLTLILTLSRAAFISFFIALFFVMIYALKDKRKTIIYIAITILIIFCVILTSYLYVTNKDTAIFISTKNRLMIYTYALDAFSQHPLLGIGYNNFSFYTNIMYIPGLFWGAYLWFPEINNILLQLFTETGLIGTFIFTILIYKIVQSLQVLKEIDSFFNFKEIIYVTGIALFIFALFFSLISQLFIWVWIGLILSVVSLKHP